ncbi:MAG: histidine--tRNA ligase [Deltaproteobacteria bacterium RBG_13_52_11]|nr:MAG: histidine--tRNA ligase [Deltaproteobacteria bacterium RBG_13_52_11]
MLEERAREILEGFGFSEIRVPILEKAELFSRSIGEETDIVEKEMYTFEDRSGDRITLRPEATASIVRAYIEHKMYTTDPMAKFYSIGPMFRHERPQKGRYRQFHQINVEVFGISHPTIDAEVMAIVMYYLSTVGVKRCVLQINSLGCPRCRHPYKENLKTFLNDHLHQLCRDCRRRMERNALRAFDCKVQGCQEIIAEAPIVSDFLCSECAEHFAAVRSYLETLEVSYEVNPRMVRGLDYYTKTAFEVVAEGLGAQNAVAAGGRYDCLVEELGGPNIPGIGFAIGMERLLLILPEEHLPPGPSLFIAALGEGPQKDAFSLSYKLNRARVRTMIDYEGRSLKAQMRRAAKFGARYVLIIGEDEQRSGRAILRDMEEGKQEQIPFPSLFEEIVRRVKGGSP